MGQGEKGEFLLKPTALACGLLFLAAFVAAISVSSLLGQQASSSSRPSFEVASVKPDPKRSDYIGTNIDMGMVGTHYMATGVTASDLIQFAYNVKGFQVLGGPKWIDVDKYYVDGKVDDSSYAAWQKVPRGLQNEEMFRQMFQSLLAQRFKLEIAQKTKQLSGFALVVTQHGPKINASTVVADVGSSAPQGSHITGGKNHVVIAIENDLSIDAFASVLSGLPEFAGHQVWNRTGLGGNYSFTLRWTRQPLGAGDEQASAASVDPFAPSIWTAVQDQLGLKFENRKGPVNCIVISRIEEPTEN
jgi:uncharacterized protein (TIGR03435 family)